jgi:hypothetical protein
MPSIWVRDIAEFARCADGTSGTISTGAAHRRALAPVVPAGMRAKGGTLPGRERDVRDH